MTSLLSTVSTICIVIIAISTLFLLYRAIKGPSNPDRAVALDTIGINLMAIAGILAIKLETEYFNDIILLIGILAFIGTVAIAKFLEKGVIIERSRD
ncbi:Na(+)/H(+) antiporter subunit F1 [Bacillus hwajinpoensis]|jgi:multicomponent Na+:H+ antiporter subunit F|uniref:Na(+)/H(+) antiporter subunit F1 n=1 Tax=Guptibacillus hwajinpoensis TaxID=208199 RepID=A0A845EWS6_9BACL|nr:MULTISPECIES: Na(+)/H(+) antiporter subunit F1 [Bacillaceae]MCA0992852.1 Na(+)/H(+) antiporter subunit F1 [Pseudalkalibacillus hwajinpoensis]MYL62986.1 Na(+)/H(+) antiporter subunit F1 [Pseudalkalibacillus hwajinpoensis]PFG14009.1 multicomponent Na+:H+ antiporter subunit F [Bacillus sp. es.036]QHA92676.1 Na(+)/H(+) antiporter subunit F1 [Bacillus sp. N1-1]